MITADDPLIAADDPLIAADDPLITADDPLIAADDPLIAADDPLIATDDPPCMQVLTTALRFLMAQALVRFHRVAIQARSKLLSWANEACCVAGLRAIRDERCAGAGAGESGAGAGAGAGVDLLWARSALLLVCAHLPYDDAMAQKALLEVSRRLHRLRGAGADAPGTAPVEVWEHLGASCAAARCVLLEASAVLVQVATRRPSAVRVRPFVATLDATLAICTKSRDAEATGAVASAPLPSSSTSLAADDAAVARRGFALLRELLSAVPRREYAVDGSLLEVLSTTLAHHVRHGPPELCLGALQVLDTALETATTPVPASNGTRCVDVNVNVNASNGTRQTVGDSGSGGGGGGGGDDDDNDCDIMLAAARGEWMSALVRQLQQPCWRTPNAAGGGSALGDRISRLHTCSVGAQDGAVGTPPPRLSALVSALVRCWGRSERLLLESAFTSSGDALRKDTALRHAASAWSAATGEHQYSAGIDRKQPPGAPSLAERQARRCVPAWFARHFLRPLQGADAQLERKIVREFVQPRLEEVERIWWVAFIEPRVLPTVQPMLTQELRALAGRHPAALTLPSPLLHTLVRAPVVSVEAASFEAGRVALLATALEHVANAVQPGGASEAPSAAPPPVDAPTRSALQCQERALKKMAQTLPRLLDEVRSGGSGGSAGGPGGSGGSEGVRRYAEFAVRAAALLLGQLPFVLCANSSVMLGCLIDLLLTEGAVSAPYSACVHTQLDAVLGGLCRIARDHSSDFRTAVRKLGQGFLFPEEGARHSSGVHGAGGASGVHGAGAGTGTNEAKDPLMTSDDL